MIPSSFPLILYHSLNYPPVTLHLSPSPTQPVASYKDPSKGSQEMRRRTLANMMSSIVDELDNLEKNESQNTNRHSLPLLRQRQKTDNRAPHPPIGPAPPSTVSVCFGNCLSV